MRRTVVIPNSSITIAVDAISSTCISPENQRQIQVTADGFRFEYTYESAEEAERNLRTINSIWSAEGRPIFELKRNTGTIPG